MFEPTAVGDGGCLREVVQLISDSVLTALGQDDISDPKNASQRNGYGKQDSKRSSVKIGAVCPLHNVRLLRY